MVFLACIACLLIIRPVQVYAANDVSRTPLFKQSLVKSIQGFDERSKMMTTQYTVSQNENSTASNTAGEAVSNKLALATMSATCLSTCNTTCLGATCSGVTCGTTCSATCLGPTCTGLTCNGVTCGSTCLGATCSGATCDGATCSGVTCGTTCLGATCIGSTCGGPTCSGLTCNGLTCSSTCLITCSGATCDAATCSGATCGLTCGTTCVTCHITCSGSATCSSCPTFGGSSTCLGATCVGSSTCFGPTCAGSPTCSDTCGLGGDEIEISRLWGMDRYETSTQIASYGWPDGSEYALLATGENYPDALGAAPLAKKLNAPILLTEKDSLNFNTVVMLNSMDVKKVFIIGGSGVVSDGIKNMLSSANIVVERLWGMDRYETSVAVADKMGECSEVFLATGEDFPDALSIGPIAAAKSAPILLTEKSRLPDCVRQYINSHNINKIYVIGGTDVISEEVTNGLSNVERITGADKYQRNINIIDRFSNDVNIVDIRKVCVATGENFPDALSGSAFAAPLKSPVILVSENLSDYTKNYVRGKISIIDKAYVFGGTGAVSDSVIDSLFK